MTATDINVEWEIYGLLLMKIKTFFIFVFFGSVSISSNADFSIDRPIWDQVDELICVGKSRLDCSYDGCEEGKSSALWKVNFSKRKIDFLNADFNYTIDDFFFKFYPTIKKSNNHIFFFGGLMSFDLAQGKLINAQVVRSYWKLGMPETHQTTYECHAQ